MEAKMISNAEWKTINVDVCWLTILISNFEINLLFFMSASRIHHFNSYMYKSDLEVGLRLMRTCISQSIYILLNSYDLRE